MNKEQKEALNKVIQQSEMLKDFFELNNITPSECLTVLMHFIPDVMDWLEVEDKERRRFLKIMKEALFPKEIKCKK